MNEADRMRNIVASYMREGLVKGDAIRAAADCADRLEQRKAELIKLRTALRENAPSHLVEERE